jgi:hypothetical protein
MDCEDLLVLVGALAPLLSPVWCSDFEGDASTCCDWCFSDANR